MKKGVAKYDVMTYILSSKFTITRKKEKKDV